MAQIVGAALRRLLAGQTRRYRREFQILDLGTVTVLFRELGRTEVRPSLVRHICPYLPVCQIWQIKAARQIPYRSHIKEMT